MSPPSSSLIFVGRPDSVKTGLHSLRKGGNHYSTLPQRTPFVSPVSSLLLWPVGRRARILLPLYPWSHEANREALSEYGTPFGYRIVGIPPVLVGLFEKRSSAKGAVPTPCLRRCGVFIFSPVLSWSYIKVACSTLLWPRAEPLLLLSSCRKAIGENINWL